MPTIYPSYGSNVRVSITWPELKRVDNDDGCWTCKENGVHCDLALPACHTCRTQSRICAGYGLQMKVPLLDVFNESTSPKPSLSLSTFQLSHLCLPSTQTYFLQHFTKNLARIALAVDYEGNGYRKWMQAATTDALLLDTILAVAVSHHAKWQQQSRLDESHIHYNRALSRLRDRLQDPVMVRCENTLAAMMFLISYEVFNGSNRWKRHHAGVMAWIGAFGHLIAIDPFLKTWISMVDTQSALNTGMSVAPQVETWLNDRFGPRGEKQLIDPFFGCSTELPAIMLRAANLYSTARNISISDPSGRELVKIQVEELQRRLMAMKMDVTVAPVFAMTCDNVVESLSPIHYLTQNESFTRSVAVAEIFRYATLIYILRIIHPHTSDQIPEIHELMNSALELLPCVPDVVGPGSNLGWAFVVIGSELNEEEQREYIRGRLQGLYSLALQNVASGERVLEEVWRNRDEARFGREQYRGWQEIMQSLSLEQILI